MSLFDGARDASPKPFDPTWEELIAYLTPHTASEDKTSTRALSPAHFEPARRANDNVTHLSLFVGDLDEVDEDAARDFTDRLLQRGWSAVLGTSYSHARKPYSLRPIIPLSRAVTPDEWRQLWPTINAELGGHCDPACKDPSRLYFVFAAPAADLHHHWIEVFKGDPIDVDALLARPTPPVPPTPTPKATTFTRERLASFARRLTRSTNDTKHEAGTLLAQVVKGERFADPGNIDNAMFRLAAMLANRFPDVDADAIAAHFAPSLQLMAKHDPPEYACEPQQIADKIARAQSKIADEHAAEHVEEHEARTTRIKEAFRDGRANPYEPDEFAPPKRWIVQKGASYYTFVAGAYRGPYTKDEIQNAALTDLAPAYTAGVDLYTATQQGDIIPKTTAALVRDYGTIAVSVVASLTAEHAHFDERTRNMIEAPCPLRTDIKPKHHTEIDAWIEAFAGERVHELKAWIAAVTLLDRPCTGLFLTGAKATGKSLLPNGLARLWTTLSLPTSLEQVLSGFNAALMQCPLVHADEHLPTDFRGKVKSADIRHTIQARTRPLKRKFIADAILVGSLRLVVSANDEEILATNENLSNFDIGAIVDRWLHVAVQELAAAFLKDTPNHTQWVESDAVAEHALWLRDNYEWQPNGRFLVHHDDAELHSRLISGSGVRSSVLQFCVSYLTKPSLVDNDAQTAFLIRTYKGELLVNVQALVNGWSHYVKNEHCPPTGILGRAIAALSSHRTRVARPNVGGLPNYHVIDPEHLFAWSKRNGYANREDIEAALEVDTEEKNKHLLPN